MVTGIIGVYYDKYILVIFVGEIEQRGRDNTESGNHLDIMDFQTVKTIRKGSQSKTKVTKNSKK